MNKWGKSVPRTREERVYHEQEGKECTAEVEVTCMRIRFDLRQRPEAAATKRVTKIEKVAVNVYDSQSKAATSPNNAIMVCAHES